MRVFPKFGKGGVDGFRGEEMEAGFMTARRAKKKPVAEHSASGLIHLPHEAAGVCIAELL